MIAANTATAQFLESRGFSSMRRIVRMPDRWPRIVTLAAGTGTTLPTTPDVQALEHWLLAQRERDPEHFPDLSLSVVKLLGRGTYVYTTLSLFRQLPAGVPGAARLLVNLLAAGQRPVAQ